MCLFTDSDLPDTDNIVPFEKYLFDYCKTHFFRVPFISQISQAWQVRKNNGLWKFEYSSVSV